MAADIDIVLATYNGEKYLAQQLDSLLNQSYGSWRLLVRDDGSGDATRAILADYGKRHPDKIRLVEEPSGNLGAAANFSALLQRCTAEYTMFCDQDDVWLPHKIEATLAAMRRLARECAEGTPLLVYTDMKVVDQALGVACDSAWRFQKLDPACGLKLNRQLPHNVVTGCTMMMNRALRELASPIPEQAYMHDWWVALVAAAFGRGAFLPEPTLLYRRHGANTVGVERWSLRHEVEKAFDPARRAADAARTAGRLASFRLQAQAFLERYGASLPPQTRKMVGAYARLDRHGALRRKYYVLRYRFFYPDPLVTAAMILCRW